MRRTKIIFFLFFFIFISHDVIAQRYPYQVFYLPTEERARDLCHRLTLDEKISLMMDHSPAIARLGIPQFEWWNEALHGVARNGTATVFPVTIGMAASFDDQLVYKVFSAVSDEARAKNNFARDSVKNIKRYQGLSFWTPNINIFRDPRWGRGQETYGEDPYLTSRMGLAVVRGLQGDPGQKYKKVLACAKHFAVHSGPESSRHSMDIENLSQRDLWETYLPAFQSLVQKGNVAEVMCAYQRLDGQPCCGNNKLLEQILRKDWGFKGIVVSDCGAISDFWMKGHHEVSTDSADASAKAVLAGTDVECGNNFSSLKEAVKAGKITEKQIDENVMRLLKARFDVGDFDDAKQNPYRKLQMSVVASKRNKNLALKMARESMVLLQNWNDVLPLSKTDNDVVVMGPNANDSIMQWGNYNGIPTHTITILQGIKEKNPNIKYIEGCGLTKNTLTNEEIISRVGATNKVIFVGGISPKLEGEEMNVNEPGFKGGDRTTIELPQAQRDLIKALRDAGKTIIYVNCSGSAIGLEPEADNADAILQAWYPGEMGGRAVADVLFGDYNPGGKLPVTFYRHDSDLPDFDDYSMANRTYRYFKGDPLFPFGYGISYTTFDIKPQEFKDGHLLVTVTNTGTRAGSEVVQMYIRRPQDVDGPSKTLRGFKRVDVPAGQTKTVDVGIADKEHLQLWDASTNTMRFIPGDYEIYIGNSSQRKDLKKYTMTINQVIPDQSEEYNDNDDN